MWQTASRPTFRITENVLFNRGWAGSCGTEQDTLVQHSTEQSAWRRCFSPGLASPRFYTDDTPGRMDSLLDPENLVDTCHLQQSQSHDVAFPAPNRTVSWGIRRLPGKRRYEQPDFSSPVTEELILQMKHQGSCVREAGRAVSGTEGTLRISIIFPRKPIRLRQVRATQFRGRLWCKERGQGTSFWASECRWPWEPVYTEVTGRQGCWSQLVAWRLDEGRGDRHVSFLFFSLQFLSKSFDFCFFFFKIPDYFEQCCEQIKDAFLGHNNILLISFKKLIRLQRHSTERVHGPLPWIEAENPHVNQPVIDESVRDAGACLKQMSNIPELGIYTVHSLSIYSFPHV